MRDKIYIWFNPFAWAAFVLLCADMEMSCDERVLRELGMGAKADYSQTLLSLSMNRRILGASPLAFGEGGVKERVKNVLNFKKPARVVIVVAIALVAVISVGFAVNRASGGGRTVDEIIGSDDPRFRGVAEEVYDKAILVRVNDSEEIRKSSDLISVSLANANRDANSGYAIGDTVCVYYNGSIAESYPAQISAYAVLIEERAIMSDYQTDSQGMKIPNLRAVSADEVYGFKRFGYEWTIDNGDGTSTSGVADSIAPWQADWDASNTISATGETKLVVNCPSPFEEVSHVVYAENGTIIESGTRSPASMRLAENSDGTYTMFTPSEPGVYYYGIDAKFAENGLRVSYAVKIVIEPARNADSSTSSTNEAGYQQRLQDGIEHESFDGFNVGGTSESEVKRLMGREPDGILSGFWGDIYLLGDGTELIFYYDANSIVSRILQKSVTDAPTMKNYVTAAPAAWSPDMPLGVEGAPSLDYASDKYIILHSYFGMFVYELQSQRIIRSLDLAAIGCHYTQGSDYCEVAVSADGGKVYLRTMEMRKMYVWDLTAEPELSLYTGDFERDWPTEPFKTVSIEAAVSTALTTELGRYSVRAVDFGGYYGYLYASNGGNIGGLWYTVDDMVYDDLFSKRTSTALAFLAEPFSYGATAKEIRSCEIIS
jgi:hypothetical protein